MKQRAEVVATNSGTRIRFEQSQREVALSRDDVVFLTQIHDRFLLEEARARGYRLIAEDVVGSKGVPGGHDALLDLLIDDVCVRGGRPIKELTPLLVDRAVRRFGTQKSAAQMLGMSCRNVNYWVKGRRPRLLKGFFDNESDGGKNGDAGAVIDVVSPDDGQKGPGAKDDWDW